MQNCLNFRQWVINKIIQEDKFDLHFYRHTYMVTAIAQTGELHW